MTVNAETTLLSEQQMMFEGAWQRLTLAQRDLLETFTRQAALVLDRIELRTEAEHASLLAESEKFSRTLLNSISHELRTPLAASVSAEELRQV